MQPLRLGWYLSLFTLGVTLCLVAQGQKQPLPHSSVPVPADRFVGSWKLNVAKSSAPPDSESITIESQGSDFKLTYDIVYGNGYESKHWTVTDMRGAIVKLTQADGKAMSDQWRVTRDGPDVFVVDKLGPFGGGQDRYEVSADGKTMTIRTIPGKTGLVGGKLENGVLISAPPVLVFDRVQ
jgi:hypothetical protein